MGLFFKTIGSVLCTRHIRRGRALFAIYDIKGDLITDFEFVKSYALQLFRMEKKILRFALAGDKTESPVRERFDCSFHHVFVVVC